MNVWEKKRPPRYIIGWPFFGKKQFPISTKLNPVCERLNLAGPAGGAGRAKEPGE